MGKPQRIPDSALHGGGKHVVPAIEEDNPLEVVAQLRQGRAVNVWLLELDKKLTVLIT